MRSWGLVQYLVGAIGSDHALRHEQTTLHCVMKVSMTGTRSKVIGVDALVLATITITGDTAMRRPRGADTGKRGEKESMQSRHNLAEEIMLKDNTRQLQEVTTTGMTEERPTGWSLVTEVVTTAVIRP